MAVAAVVGAIVAVAAVFGAQAESNISVQITMEITTKRFFISSSPWGMVD
jgi:hypothetical protein